jgi:hypothetical protein
MSGTYEAEEEWLSTDEAYEKGWREGVKAAREAVANCPAVKWYPNGLVQKQVLAAIDGVAQQDEKEA